VDVYVAAYACIDLLKESAAQKQITIANKIEAGALVYADNNMLDAILRNLLSNSIKFTPHGGEIAIEAQTRDGFVEIAVVDNGVGMSEDKVQRLFKLGERNLSTAGTSGEIGAGLGLILCREFVEKHGGEIRAESQKGQGSKLTFTLPRFDRDEEDK
jgi:two-component system, sensor histidine kinase and response regulator